MAGTFPPHLGQHRRARTVPGLREEARTFFRLSPAERAARCGCFAVRRGKIIRKADVASHNPDLQILLQRLESGPFESVDLRCLVQDEGGIRYGTGSPPTILPPSDDTVPFIRATDIKDGEIQIGSLLHVDRDQPPHMLKCLLREGEVILVRSGVNTGDCAPVPASLAGAYGAYDLILRLKEGKNEVLPSFLTSYLDTSVGRGQLNVLKARSAQPHLNAEEIGSIQVPLPKSQKQRQLLAPLVAARAAWRERLAQANALLGGLDSFVLDALGLALPPRDYRTTYAVRSRDVYAAQKLYPDYFHPERINAIRAVESRYTGDGATTLLGIADFIRDQHIVEPDDEYLGLANVQPNTGERIDSNEEDGKGNCFSYAEDDILFARLRPYLNKVYRAEANGVCSTEFHVIRIRLDERGRPLLIPDYLAAVLRSSLVLAQTRHMMTGNTHPRLANEDVVNLVVPVPDGDVQAKIAAEVARHRLKARRLRDEARILWDEAKRLFEEELLGPETVANELKVGGAKGGKR